MLLKTPSESGKIIHPSEIDETLKYYSNPWDYPYDQLCNFRTDSLSGTISFFRNMDDWCFAEHFDKNTLLQVSFGRVSYFDNQNVVQNTMLKTISTAKLSYSFILRKLPKKT